MALRNTRSAALLSALALSLGLASLANPQTASADFLGISNVDLPNASLFALTSDSTLYVQPRFGDDFVRLGQISSGTSGNPGNFIGIDFRPADGNLYGLDDRGNIFIIDTSTFGFGRLTAVTTMSPRFIGGFGNVMDFNPVVNALRVTGSTDQNIAVVNGANGANLATTTAQTKLAYAAGDPNAGVDPEIIGGAYNNNVNGATVTIFYMIDHDKDTLVTIAQKNATGSSNTGGGQLKTIGSLVDSRGNKVNVGPASDFDIFTNAAGKNFLVGSTNDAQLFSIDLQKVNANNAVGTTTNVVVNIGNPAFDPGTISPVVTGTFIDVAVETAN
jgi:hypothetical protein